NMAAQSRLREVARQFALELRKVMGDPGDVEKPENRPLGFAIEQELERRLDTTYRRVSACRQSLASVSRHRHMMASLAASGTHDHLEFEWIAFAGSLDIQHRSGTSRLVLANSIYPTVRPGWRVQMQ